MDRAMLRLDFLRLYATEDVVLKRLWPAEELCFGSAHLHARIEFEGNHVQCADEIRERVGTDPSQRAFYRVFRDFSPLNDLVNRVEAPRSGCFRAGAETGATNPPR